MNYPDNCNSARKRTEYLYKAQELLRSLHNDFSKWLHEGLSKDQYNSLSPEIKFKYPYVANLSQKNWNKFQKENFMPCSKKICEEICVQREQFKESKEWSVDIGEI